MPSFSSNLCICNIEKTILCWDVSSNLAITLLSNLLNVSLFGVVLKQGNEENL